MRRSNGFSALVLAACLVALLGAACGDSDTGDTQIGGVQSASSGQAEGSKVTLADLSLDQRELAWVAARKSGGEPVTAAMRIREDTYVPKPDGGADGFDYELLLAFGEALGLPVTIVDQTTIDAFFTRDGVMPKDLGAPGSEYGYTPDLLKTVDLYGGPFAVVPWRQRLMTMIPLFPTRSQLAGRIGEEISTVKDMDGKRIAVIKDSIQHRNLKSLAERANLSFGYVYASGETELFDLVADGKADYFLDGSVYFAKNSAKLTGISLSPFPEEVISTGWGVKKDDGKLVSILGKFMAASLRSGLFGSLWSKTFGMDFDAYIRAVLTTAESAGAAP